MNANWVLLIVGLIGIVPGQAIASDVPPAFEVAPLPHIPAPPVAINAVKGGYRIRLNRATAEMLREAMDGTDEKQISRSLREMAKEKRGSAKNMDDQTAATLEMIAFVVSSQLPGFKKSLAENMGAKGVAITLTGLQTPTIRFAKRRPRLERALEITRGVLPLLPDDLKETVEGIRAVARTTPLFWKVEAQK